MLSRQALLLPRLVIPLRLSVPSIPYLGSELAVLPAPPSAPQTTLRCACRKAWSTGVGRDDGHDHAHDHEPRCRHVAPQASAPSPWPLQVLPAPGPSRPLTLSAPGPCYACSSSATPTSAAGCSRPPAVLHPFNNRNSSTLTLSALLTLSPPGPFKACSSCSPSSRSTPLQRLDLLTPLSSPCPLQAPSAPAAPAPAQHSAAPAPAAAPRPPPAPAAPAPAVAPGR